MRFRCIRCGHATANLPASCDCSKCGGLLEADLGRPRLAAGWRKRPLGVWRYREFLPRPAKAEPVTLAEGGTPLLDAPRLARSMGLKRLQLKLEGQNPTGSFKDRGMTCGVTWYAAEGAKAMGCASTGNTAASLAAYAARAATKAIVLLPAGQVALGKVAQAMAHGATVLEVDGNFDDAMRLMLELAADGSLALLNSKNPLRLEGQKTLMFEILDQRGLDVPDRVVYPVGNAGNISAGHKALVEYQASKLIRDLPRLTGVQAAGASPVADAIERGADEVVAVKDPQTLATAIRIGQPVSAAKALAAIRATDGTATKVSDEEIVAAQGDLARLEGVFAEPASCAAVAGLRRLAQAGKLGRREEVVCVLTGHGLKDPGAAERLAARPRRVAADRTSILEAIA